MIPRSIGLTLLAITLAGCAAYKPPKKRDINKTQVYALMYDVVWNRAVEWFAVNNTPIKNLDKSSGLISTEFNLSSDLYKSCDCGKAGFGQSVSPNVLGNFNVLIRQKSDSTVMVAVSAFFKTAVTTSSMTANTADYVSQIDCESTGYIETSILEHLGR